MKKIILFSLLLVMFPVYDVVSVMPSITKSVVAGTTFKFTETLSGVLPTGYQVKIDISNGKGLVAMNCSATICTLSSNTLPFGVDSAIYKVGVYDSKGILQGTTTVGTYQINGAAKTFSYTKISNKGMELPDSAKLGNEPNDWACTKDNKTKLIWEVKTTDGGLRDMNKQYTNFTVAYPKCDSCDASTGKYGDSTNTDGFIKAVNTKTLCGAANWRLPNQVELKGLSNCSDGKYNKDGTCPSGLVTSPTINEIYFPNTQPNYYWAFSTLAEVSMLGCCGTGINVLFEGHVAMGNGSMGMIDMSANDISVRLVR
jgi:hypothetical protein